MTALGNIGGEWFYGILGLTPLEKWRAVRSGSRSVGSWWTSNTFVLSALAVVVVLLICLILLRRRREREAWSALRQAARERGVTDKEFQVLAEVVKRVKPKTFLAVFLTDVAFDRGALAYLQSGRFARLSLEDKHEALGLVESLREKMDFAQAADLLSPGARATGSLQAGTDLTVFADGSSQSFQASLASTNAVDMAIEPALPVSHRDGQKLRVQFVEDGRLLEFDTTVVRGRNGKIIINHADEIRPANRRRFARVRVSLWGRVALRGKHWSSQGGQFEDAEVVEVGGPGLRLATALQAKKDDRLLVEIELPGGYALQRTAIIRRVAGRSGGKNVYGVELLALTDHEVAELVRVGNEAERLRRARQAEPQESIPTAPAAQQSR